jgi:NADPH:quinone reductase-like Zn-dependent oxidoreductase
MSQQKALLLPAAGEDYYVGTRDIPKPGKGQVVVKNHAVALNPVDNYIQKYGIFVSPHGFPAVAGSDAAGEIYALGEDVQGWKKGDKVCVSHWKSSSVLGY